MDHHLIIREENGDRTFPLPEGKTHIGRASSNEIKLREKSVSRSHCLIERDGDRVLIFDNRTGNPTQIQRHGKKRSKKANGRILRDQDVLFVGRMEIVYRGCSGPRAATSSQQGDVSPIPGAVPVESPPPATDPGIQQTPPRHPTHMGERSRFDGAIYVSYMFVSTLFHP
ncbi:MAG: FHA domain-containing protein, partial [Planctomycetes bacterium]|nr:FHA domain-containing protein [Planctomycetota bacterium]